jgi:general stress protein YciG
MAKKKRGNAGSGSGFAAMGDEKQREIARKGGVSVPAEKRTFSQDPKLASEAGRKGGQTSSGGPRADNDEQDDPALRDVGTEDEEAGKEAANPRDSGSTERAAQAGRKNGDSTRGKSDGAGR